MSKTPILIAALAGGAIASAASAQLSSNFIVPSFRGDANTAYSQWENFTAAFTPGPVGNAPDVASGAGGQIFQNTAPAPDPDGLEPPVVVTSAGNIYTGWQVGDFELTADAAADLQTVSLQVATSGNRFDWSGFTLDYGGGIVAPDMINALFDEELQFPTPGGVVTSYNQVYQLTWDLSSVADEVLSYTIDFTTDEPSISLDAVALDVLVVPAPGGAGVLALGGLALVRRRR